MNKLDVYYCLAHNLEHSKDVSFSEYSRYVEALEDKVTETSGKRIFKQLFVGIHWLLNAADKS